MTKKQRPQGIDLSDAIRDQRDSTRETDRSNLAKSLVKSSIWKKNMLERIEAARSSMPADAAPEILNAFKQALVDLVEQHWQELVVNASASNDSGLYKQQSAPGSDDDEVARQEATNVRKLLALHAKSMEDAKHCLYEQWAKRYVRGKKIERLREKLGRLEAEKNRMAEEHRLLIAAQEKKYLELHEAYAQFQQQSDLLLNELDQENTILKEMHVH